MTSFARHLRFRSEPRRGFTLIELIIYVALISIFSLVFVNFVFDVISTAEKARVRQELQQNARFALDRMLQEIRSAQSINTGSSTFGTSPGVLSVSTATPGTNPTIFDVSGGVLRVKLGAASAVPITDSKYVVTNLVFDDLSVSNKTVNVRVSLTLAHPNPTNTDTYAAQVTLTGAAHVRTQAD